MAEQAGFDFLVYVGDGASPEVFTKLAGLEATSFEANDEPVDVNDKDATNRWTKRKRFGFRSLSMSGGGVFKDEAVDETLRANFFDTNDVVKNFRLVIPSFGNLEGPMILNTYGMDGPAGEKVTYSFELSSADEIVYSAAA